MVIKNVLYDMQWKGRGRDGLNPQMSPQMQRKRTLKHYIPMRDKNVTRGNENGIREVRHTRPPSGGVGEEG